MASKDHNAEESRVNATPRQPSQDPMDEKAAGMHNEIAHEAAERGHVATDKYVSLASLWSSVLHTVY